MRKLCKIQLNKDKLVSARKIKKIQNKNIAKKKRKKGKMKMIGMTAMHEGSQLRKLIHSFQ